MVEERGKPVEQDLGMKAAVEGLVPLVAEYIATKWDWRPWMTEPPRIPLVDGGPLAQAPGTFSPTDWIITFEGAYPWANDFGWVQFEEGPVKQYVEANGLFLEAYAGYAIGVYRKRD